MYIHYEATVLLREVACQICDTLALPCQRLNLDLQLRYLLVLFLQPLAQSCLLLMLLLLRSHIHMYVSCESYGCEDIQTHRCIEIHRERVRYVDT